MTDDHSRPPDLIASGLVGLIEGLRSDMREDLAELRADVREDLAEMTAQVTTIDGRVREIREQQIEFAQAHAEQHELEDQDRRAAHGAFYDFMRKAELDQARRDGALGIVRFGVELVSRHAGRLVQVALALAALLGIATGSIHLAVGS